MRKHYILILLLCACVTSLQAQELFPLTEPASSMPKGVLGVRAFTQTYEEIHSQHRNLFGVKLMYGLTSKLTVMATPTVSNHHSKTLPPEFPDHNTPQIGVHLPYLFNGVNLYAKYRFLTIDGQNNHFRMAGYAEYGLLKVAHDEAEPNLLEDTRGFGGGVIATYLNKRFAASFTGGFILPAKFEGEVPDFYPGLPGVPAKVEYGKALNYSLSLGYLLLPRKYNDYNQTNFNVYVEFIGKSYDKAKIFFDNIGTPGTPYEVTGTGSAALNKGNYIEIHPGVQAIIKSNLRVDFSVGFPMVNKSYAHFYPLYYIALQRYFYF